MVLKQFVLNVTAAKQLPQHNYVDVGNTIDNSNEQKTVLIFIYSDYFFRNYNAMEQK